MQHRNSTAALRPRMNVMGRNRTGDGVRRFRLPCALLAACVLLGLSSVAAAQEPLAAQRLVQTVGLDQHLNAQVPLDLTFRDEQGRSVTLKDCAENKPVILSLVYYRCPMLCNEVLNGILRSAQAVKFTMGDEYEVISVSFDPSESPKIAAAKKDEYVKRYRRAGADSGWHFLTGDQEAIERLAKTVGFRYQFDPTSGQFAHASGIMLLTPEGRISRYFYGVDYNPKDLRLGLVESSRNQIGSAVDQVLLLCFHYDPKTGKYGLAISRTIQMAGTATVLGLGVFLWNMYRLERRRSAAVKQQPEPEPGSAGAYHD